MHCWVVVEGCKLIYCNQDKCLNLELYKREACLASFVVVVVVIKRKEKRKLSFAFFGHWNGNIF
jgi:hypothetical protein